MEDQIVIVLKEISSSLKELLELFKKNYSPEAHLPLISADTDDSADDDDSKKDQVRLLLHIFFTRLIISSRCRKLSHFKYTVICNHFAG